MAIIIPKIGAKGIYNLLSPFNNILIKDTHYTCVGVRTIADIVGAGLDVYEEYYQPFNISDSDYKKDIDANVCIITLQDENGNLIYIPHTYIEGYPEVNGYVYNNIILAIELEAIPDYLNLSHLKTRIKDLVTETIGVNNEVKSVITSAPTIIMNDDHAAIEAARLGRIQTTVTDYKRYLDAAKERDSLAQKVNALEQHIIAITNH